MTIGASSEPPAGHAWSTSTIFGGRGATPFVVSADSALAGGSSAGRSSEPVGRCVE
jgi:hypothetical protein